MLNDDSVNYEEIKRMIPYNTGMKKLILPEYGRLVQEMAIAALEIEDREIRSEYAAMIVEVMKSVLQDKNKDHDEKKYWDHLHIITGFGLDIDGPFPKPEREIVNQKPRKIPYTSTNFKYRHYGLTLQKMIEKVARMENSEERDLYVDLISNHIKKLLTLNNPESANDGHVFKDLADISNGRIELTEELFSLPEYKEDKPQNNKQNKKKK